MKNKKTIASYPIGAMRRRMDVKIQRPTVAYIQCKLSSVHFPTEKYHLQEFRTHTHTRTHTHRGALNTHSSRRPSLTVTFCKVENHSYMEMTITCRKSYMINRILLNRWDITFTWPGFNWRSIEYGTSHDTIFWQSCKGVASWWKSWKKGMESWIPSSLDINKWISSYRA